MSPISLDSILPVESKDNLILRGIYGFPKHPLVMHMVELLSFTLLPSIPHGGSLQISSSEMIKSLIFWSICLGFNIIDGKMN